MALSNTATPEHYGAFRARVLAKEIPVNKEISMQMNLIKLILIQSLKKWDLLILNLM